ncbi:hypothetical protein AURDEDRAFT_172526 [Auricularia subglabra TFB-10046 SS5]|nr:hypothetical protein AURDEDRAFT_172526 [Auricularia subglabra TFB-10046 SS5]
MVAAERVADHMTRALISLHPLTTPTTVSACAWAVAVRCVQGVTLTVVRICKTISRLPFKKARSAVVQDVTLIVVRGCKNISRTPFRIFAGGASQPRFADANTGELDEPPPTLTLPLSLLDQVTPIRSIGSSLMSTSTNEWHDAAARVSLEERQSEIEKLRRKGDREADDIVHCEQKVLVDHLDIVIKHCNIQEVRLVVRAIDLTTPRPDEIPSAHPSPTLSSDGSTLPSRADLHHSLLDPCRSQLTHGTCATTASRGNLNLSVDFASPSMQAFRSGEVLGYFTGWNAAGHWLPDDGSSAHYKFESEL